MPESLWECVAEAKRTTVATRSPSIAAARVKQAQTPLRKNMTTAERFALFHRTHPEVYALFRQFAEELLAAGRRRYSARAIIYRIRWHTDIKGGRGEATDGGNGWKIDNYFSAYYARMLARDDQRFAMFFEFRESGCDLED